MAKSKKNKIYGNMPTAVIYARYSCEKQTEQSIEGQLDVCEKYAEQLGIKLIGTPYIDRALSGKTHDRPAFLRMIADSAKKEFDYIIVYKLDRFARNRYDSATFKYKLQQNGVRVLSATEQINDNPESVMFEAILEAQAEYYSLELSQKVRRGMKISAEKGNSVGGQPPLGYRYSSDKSLVIVENDAKVIRIIFEMYAKGIGKKAIADYLNEHGYKTARNLPFKVSSFERILNNPKYVGDFCYNGEITCAGGCPAIINNETFDAVQARLKLNAYAPAASRSIHKYLLTGKMFCGNCGAALTGYKGKNRNGVSYFYYGCNNMRYKHTCNKTIERAEIIEQFVADRAQQLLLNEPAIDKISKSFVDYYNTEYGKGELSAVETQLAGINRKINNISEIIADTGNRALLSKLSELEQQRAELQEKLFELRITSKSNPTAQDVKDWLGGFLDGSLHNAEFLKSIIDYLINAVYITDTSITIAFNIGPAETITFDEYKKNIHEQVFVNKRVWLPDAEQTRTFLFVNTCLLYYISR